MFKLDILFLFLMHVAASVRVQWLVINYFLQFGQAGQANGHSSYLMLLNKIVLLLSVFLLSSVSSSNVCALANGATNSFSLLSQHR